MVLKGDLTSVPLGDVLQTLFQNEKEGRLQLTGQDYSKSIYCCPRGITLLEPEVLNKRRFGDIVIAAGLCKRTTLESILSESDEDLPIGQTLVTAGVLDQDIVKRILHIQIEEEIFDLFNLSSGEFEFFENERGLPNVEEAGLPLFQVEGVVFEAARRMDEWDFIHKHIGDLDSVFIRQPVDAESLQPDEKTILGCIDGRTTLLNIADRLITSPFEVAKVAAGLAKKNMIREADTQELLALAQDLIDQNEVIQAATILKKLRPGIKDIHFDEEELSSLANLFHQVGDILTATNILLNKIKQAKESGHHADTLTLLKQAHRISPRDTRILTELAKVSDDVGDRDLRIHYLVSLAKVHIHEGKQDLAIEACRDILDADPSNEFVLEQMPDEISTSDDKEGAIAFLEDLLEHLGKKADPRQAVNLYRKLLRFAPSRKDIQEKLQKAQRRAHNYKMKTVYIASLIVILLGGVVSWFINTGETQTDMDRVAYVSMQLARGDIHGARAALSEIIDTLEEPEAKEQAQILLTSIETRLKQGDAIKVEVEKNNYFNELNQCRDLLEQGSYDRSIIVLKTLAESFDPIQYGKSTREELEKVLDKIELKIDLMRNLVDGFAAPTLDEEVAGIYEKYSPEITDEKIKCLNALAQMLEESAEEELFQGAVCETLTSDIRETAKKMEQVRQSLLQMETRLDRLNALADLSHCFDEAVLAETEGRLDDALDLYSRLVDGYGEGAMRDEFEAKKDELKSFFDTVDRIDSCAKNNEVETAYDLATGLLNSYDDEAHRNFVQVPVYLNSMPEAAKIRFQGQDHGVTPKLLFLLPDQSLNLTLDLEGCERAFFNVDWKAGARQTFNLNRQIHFQKKLGGIMEGRPLLNEGILFLASRNGDIFRIDPESGDLLKKFKTRSLSGISTSTVMAHGGLYFHTVEGELWCLTPELELKARASLSSGTRSKPLATGSGIISTCLDGAVVLYTPDLETVQWTHQAAGKILTEPILINDKLYTADITGTVACLSLNDGQVIWRTDVGSASIKGMDAADGSLAICTSDGWVTSLSLADGSKQWSVELDAYIHLPPRITEERVVVFANHAVYFLERAEGEQCGGFKLDDEITSVSKIDSNCLCLGTREGLLHYRCLDESSDQWIFQAHGAIIAPPLITDEAVFITDEKGYLSSIRR